MYMSTSSHHTTVVPAASSALRCALWTTRHGGPRGATSKASKGLCHLGLGSRMEHQMEKNMENETETLGPFKEYIGVATTPIMESEIRNNMEYEMETAVM